MDYYLFLSHVSAQLVSQTVKNVACYFNRFGVLLKYEKSCPNNNGMWKDLAKIKPSTKLSVTRDS